MSDKMEAEDFLSAENARTCIIATTNQRFLHSCDAKDDDGDISSRGALVCRG